jgi:hypothetical protein
MCKVKECEKLKNVNSELLNKYSDAEVIESQYHRYMGAYAIKVVAKTPPMHDRTLKKVNELTICNLGRHRATSVKVPKHFTKVSSATGSQVVQNFYVPADFLGQTIELFVNVERRVNRNGKVAYVINYYQVPPESKKNRAIRLKIGTPKRYAREVKAIDLPKGTRIVFFIPN